jgi:predicted dehydrogenase
VRVTVLRAVHVGVGNWGRSWAELLAAAPGYRLVGVAEASAEGRTWAQQALGVPAFRDLPRALRATEADVVLLVSPPSTHRPLSEAALASGCHVISEKPIALDLKDARAIAAAADAAARYAMVAQNYRFRRQPRALRELLRGKGHALGSLLGVRISCRRDLRRAHITRRDWRGQMPHPYLLDMAIHHVDMLRMITGLEIAEVDARSWPVPDSPFRHDPTVGALLTLADGTPISYEGTWAEPRIETSWNGDWEMVGSRGRATWTGGVDDALRGTVRYARHGEPPAPVRLPTLPAIDRAAVLAELRRAVAAGEQPETAVADNVRSLATIFAIARSTEERRPVRVDEILTP